MAALNGHTAVVEILVKAGADVNEVSDVGCGEVLNVYCTAFLYPHLPYVEQTTVCGSSKWSYSCGGDPCKGRS